VELHKELAMFLYLILIIKSDRRSQLLTADILVSVHRLLQLYEYEYFLYDEKCIFVSRMFTVCYSL